MILKIKRFFLTIYYKYIIRDKSFKGFFEFDDITFDEWSGTKTIKESEILEIQIDDYEPGDTILIPVRICQSDRDNADKHNSILSNLGEDFKKAIQERKVIICDADMIDIPNIRIIRKV